MTQTLSVHNLGSGSSGNALLIRAGSAAMLVDCGVAKRTISQALTAHGLKLEHLATVAISHEHGDHIRSLDVLGEAGAPILATRGTLDALGPLGRGGCAVRAGHEHVAGPFWIRPLPVSHDATDPCGYTINVGGRRITVLTDLGQPPAGLSDVLTVSDLIVLEANYDSHMLACGPYPAHLKHRIVASTGHLSNVQCG
ncbi:MAG: MBL fold metallo-hydrolase, partial [Thermomicrobiales bacterium]